MIPFVRKYILGKSSTMEYAPHIFIVICFYFTASAVYTAFVDSREALLLRFAFTFVSMSFYIILERSSASTEIRAFLSPLMIVCTITVWAFFFGDFLVFTYTVGASLISLTYLKPKALRFFVLAIGMMQTCLVLLGFNLLGSQFTWAQNLVGLMTSMGINYVIYTFCRRYSKMLSALTEAKNEANKAAEIKGAFLSNMSHEIRTPLNAIIGMTAVGKLAKDITSAKYSYGKIEEASLHLLGIVNDVLDMAKLEAGKLELAYENFSLKNTIKSVVSIMSSAMQNKGQKLQVYVDDNIPDALIGDEQRIAQVLLNLLGNAEKFTPHKGKIKLKAQLVKEDEDSCTIEINVTDSGIGISVGQQENIFNTFFQAEADTSRKFGGTGLGLAISKNIIDTMGGTIWAASELGKGTSITFTACFKRGDLTIITQTDETNKNAEENNPTDYSDLHVLLAEDIEINREIIISLFESTGLKITCAENGVQAVDIFNKNPEIFDLIFMDVQMPEMDGYTATRNIRAINNLKAKSIPIIAMTANVLSDDVQKCLDAGMDEHIGKPIDIDEINRILEAVKG